MSENKYLTVAKMVEEMYQSSDREFAKWVWRNHVVKVAKFSEELTKKYIGDPDFSVAGAWLHDLADAFIERGPEFDQLSLQKARDVLHDAGYSENDSAVVINEILIPHSCFPGFQPTRLEGKIVATADALGHFADDFYPQLCWMHVPENKTYDEFVAWVKEKIERDYNVKIFFDDEKKKVQEKYLALKVLFS